MHKICLPKGLLSERADLRPDRADFRPKRAYWAVAPKGSMTYAFTHMGNFLLLLAIEIWVFRLRFRPEG